CLHLSRCSFFFFSSRRRHTRFSRDWSSDVCSSDLLLIPSEALAQQARGLKALLWIGVALLRIALRNAVVGGNDDLRIAAGCCKMPLDGSGERIDVDRLVMIIRNCADGWLVAQLHQGLEELVVHRGRCRRGILRIER